MNFKIHNIWKNIAFVWTNLFLILFSIYLFIWSKILFSIEILYIELHNRIWRIVIIISAIHWTFFFWSRVHWTLFLVKWVYIVLNWQIYVFLVQNWQILNRYMFFLVKRRYMLKRIIKAHIANIFFWQPLCKRGYVDMGKPSGNPTKKIIK